MMIFLAIIGGLFAGIAWALIAESNASHEQPTMFNPDTYVRHPNGEPFNKASDKSGIELD